MLFHFICSEQRLREIVDEFKVAVLQIGKVIISEVHLSPTQKTYKPLVAGVAGRDNSLSTLFSLSLFCFPISISHLLGLI
jgi:hypothetical protein